MSDTTTSRRRLAQRAGQLGGEGVFTSAAEANAKLPQARRSTPSTWETLDSRLRRT